MISALFRISARWHLPRALLSVAFGCLLLQAAHAQYVAPTGAALGEQISRDSAASRTVSRVYQGTFNYVRIETSEDAAALNLHPVHFELEDLSKLLAAVKLGENPLFTADDLDEIVPHIVRALASATPGQDVSFAVTGKHSRFGLIAARDVTTGRIFNTAAGLQLIIGLAHKPFEDRFRATGFLIPFEPGRRAAPVDPALSLRLAASSTGFLARPDWVVLAPPVLRSAGAGAAAATPTAAPPAVVMTAPANPGLAASQERAAALAGVAVPPPAEAAATTIATRPAAAPAATTTSPEPKSLSPLAPAPGFDAGSVPRAPAPLISTESDARFHEASERLKTIERLRNAGLITPQEYEDKRKQILKAL